MGEIVGAKPVVDSIASRANHSAAMSLQSIMSSGKFTGSCIQLVSFRV
jgi:hypothetical protein